QNRVLTVSCIPDQNCGVSDVCLSLPAVVGRLGITRRLNLALNRREQERLQRSAQTLRDVIEHIAF
ncbi:MAG: L-lactate dehydrogenase, partial [Nodosilinea sp.]